MMMRIVSQDGKYDFPYESAIIHCVEYCGGKCTVKAIVSGAEGSVAEYSTKEKALKVMEMLRTQYKRLETIECFIQGNVKSVDDCKSTIISIRDDHIFQFPNDEDVEV